MLSDRFIAPRGGDIAAKTLPERQAGANKGAGRIFEANSDTMVELAPGVHVRQYELIRSLGKGGMGQVFLARDNKLGRRVAIKFLNTENQAFARRFILEARATARCSHENIVTIFEADEFDGRPYLVLEYLQGKTLSKLIGENALPPSQAIDLIVPVLRALAHAHGQDIVHRDLKPDNIYVTDSGVVKVLDFGIAKVLQRENSAIEQATRHWSIPKTEVVLREDTISAFTDLTEGGALLGTLRFMSPEQWGAGEIDRRTDIWAVGIILFCMLAGKHPLANLQGMGLSIVARLDQPMPSIAGFVPGIAPALANAIDGCLQKRKEERTPDAQTLLHSLESFVSNGRRSILETDQNPYPGLCVFQEVDADRFFGRNNETAALINRIRDQASISVVGPSGIGKSSFIRAGFIPALKRSRGAWITLTIRPGRKPLTALASSIALQAGEDLTQLGLQAKDTLAERFYHEPGLAGAIIRSLANRAKANILLFVDQLEELYTLVLDKKERDIFITCLISIADDPTSPTRLVTSIRSDFLDRIAENAAFMSELSGGFFFLGPPTVDGITDALVQPAEMAGYRFEDQGMIDEMVAGLQSTPASLPLLQFTADLLWDGRDCARSMFTRERYQSIGGIAGALALHADRTISQLPPLVRNLARTLFLRLITPEKTRAVVSMEELKDTTAHKIEMENLVDRLVRARLLVVQNTEGETTVELIHESLIRGWPTLSKWIDESGDDAIYFEQLRSAVRIWESKNQSTNSLWRGDMARDASRFYARNRANLTKAQRQFLEATLAQQAKEARRKYFWMVGSLVFLSLLAAGALGTLVVIRQAQKNAVEQASAAKKAEKTAQQRLLEIEKKDRERVAAEKLAETERTKALSAHQRLLHLENDVIDADLRVKKSTNAEHVAKANADRLAQEQEKIKRIEQERRSRIESNLGAAPVEKDLE